MFLWILFFLIIAGIAFLLAYSSMSDFRIFASGKKYSLFLVRNIGMFDEELLNKLHTAVYRKKLLLSLERLFKGDKSALAIFGPRDILMSFKDDLSLVELEDYTERPPENFTAWEMGIKSEGVKPDAKFLREVSALLPSEQFWWQVVLVPIMEKNEEIFTTQVRAVFVYENEERRKELTPKLQRLSDGFLVKVPKPYAKEQILQFYKKRSLEKGEFNPYLGMKDLAVLFKF